VKLFDRERWQKVDWGIGDDAAAERVRVWLISFKYKHGFAFDIEALNGGIFALRISVDTTPSPNSDLKSLGWKSGDRFTVNHRIIIPGYLTEVDEENLTRWVFEAISQVELHETMEFFEHKGHFPFYPDHGPTADPYKITYREPVS
jgi:hypothetical protein